MKPSARRPTPSPDPAHEPGPAGRPVRTVFFGSGGFAVPVLAALAGAPEVELVAVVTAPDRPAGRHRELVAVPVVASARSLGLQVLQPTRLRAPETLAAIGGLAFALGVLADYGRIVPPEILDLPEHGILNLHPSLLPRHRGATPIQATILAGDERAGVSLIRMDAGLDTGAVVASEAWRLAGTETAPQLEERAAGAAADLLRRSLPGWLSGALPTTPQPDAGATLTRPLHRADGRLDPIHRSAVELERAVRAYQPWPGTFVETAAGRLAILRVAVADPAPTAATAQAAPGTLVADGEGLALVALAGRLRLLDVRPAGGRAMSGAELRRGRPGLVGTRIV